MLKLAVPLFDVPPSRSSVIVPMPTVTDSDAPSSVVSEVAVRMTVALLAAAFTPEKEIVGALATRSVLARFE